MQFIPNYACYLSKAVDPLICDRSVNDKNNFREVWSIVKKLLPSKLGNKVLDSYDVFFYKRTENLDKEIYYSLRFLNDNNKTENKISNKKETEIQLNVILFCSFCTGSIRFYDLKNQGKVFLNPNAKFFDVRILPGDLIFFMPEIPYEQSPTIGENYYFFFKVYYDETVDNNNNNNNNKNKIKYQNHLITKSENSSTFSTPTPNGLKYTGPSTRTWEEVEKDNRKKLKIQLAESPLFVDCTKGRTPIKYKEDYCPNCYEILQLPYKYTNCSGCLYPVIK
jgi:hypothetical protein